MQTTIPLSKLVASKRNPRKVKPEREAHQRLVASIRAHGLLEPLIVRPLENGKYSVIAGNRRLLALREIHPDDDPKIACQVHKTDEQSAEALALAENFIREAMHPLDEAIAFARQIQTEEKDITTIASNFGVTEHYVRQRMKLSGLAEPIQAAYREGTIDTGVAEMFAVLPEAKQLAIWQELGGPPINSHQLRRIIASDWIDASHALFDVSTLPPAVIMQDLFAERVLVQRAAFMDAQATALAAERQRLLDEGWSHVVIGASADVQEYYHHTQSAPYEHDPATLQKLAELENQQRDLEAKLEQLSEEDEAGLREIQQKYDRLEQQERRVADAATRVFAEPVKAIGTALLIVDPDGQVRREYRVPVSRQKRTSAIHGTTEGESEPAEEAFSPDDLSERQMAELLVHRTLAVRQAALTNRLVQKRLLVLMLHENVRRSALPIKHERNAVTDYATKPATQEQTQPPQEPPAILTELMHKRQQIDPLAIAPVSDSAISELLDEADAYERLKQLAESQLDELIAILTVQTISASLCQTEPLIEVLAAELDITQRQTWMPNADWLGGYKKPQLAHLMQELLGPVHANGAGEKKKSVLVGQLAKVFIDVAEGHITDPATTSKVNNWLPAILREPSQQHAADVVTV